jgi:uncharacterized protein (TIGR03435 family)
MLPATKWTGLGHVFVLGALTAFGQAPSAPPAFEVASVKPSDPAQTIAIRRSGYRISTSNTSLQMLITWAYDVHSDRLYGKPKWLDAVRYDIVANAPQESKPVARAPSQVSRLQQMMQVLLAERFKLLIHRETRELRMYAMVVAKSGSKIRLTEAGDNMGQNPFSMPGRGRLIGTKVSTEMLAKALSDQLGHSVQDQTGLKGVFDFTLEWEPDAESIGADGAPAPSADVRTGASLITAIQEQLGLKLEARKGPVEVLVIDHIESTPTEN